MSKLVERSIMLAKEKKEKIVKDFARTDNDTGSCDVQIALITERIKEISHHLKSFPKDNHSRRGLIKLVGTRRKFIKYLKKTNPERYSFVLEKLELKK